MNNLCYSTFMHLVKEHLAYSIEQETLARGLLEEITSPNIHAKYSSSYLSYIWSGDRDITKEVIDETEVPANKQCCLDYFKDYDANELSVHLRDDFYDKLNTLIDNDDTITMAKKNSLAKLYASTDYGKYLAYVFLYAIRKPNKQATKDVTPLEFELLQEVHLKCPLCNTPLVETKRNSSFYRFTVSKIFPEGIDPSRDADFSAIHNKPIDPDDKSNKICVCDKCATEYLFTPSVEIYDKLYRYKWMAYRHIQLESAMDTYHIEDQIIEILSKLKGVDTESDSFAVFRMKPLTLKEKILSGNNILKQSIADDNNRYFYFIQDHLSILDDINHPFKKIALEVKTFFLTLTETISDQEEIYNAIIEWILRTQRLPESYRAAAHIVVSYFVQSCEVFDEIS